MLNSITLHDEVAAADPLKPGCIFLAGPVDLQTSTERHEGFRLLRHLCLFLLLLLTVNLDFSCFLVFSREIMILKNNKIVI